MDKANLFKALKKRTKSDLLEVLGSAFDALNPRQRREIFGAFDQQASSPLNGKQLMREVGEFERDSLDEVYYAPFEINSESYRDVPEETDAWFDRLGDLLKASAKLTEQSAHDQAVACFRRLYKLIEKMENGEDIVFADELGSWMIPCQEKDMLAAYIASLAATASPPAFASEHFKITAPAIRSPTATRAPSAPDSKAIPLRTPQQFLIEMLSAVRRLQIRLPGSIHERICKLAKQGKLSMNQFMMTAISNEIVGHRFPDPDGPRSDAAVH